MQETQEMQVASLGSEDGLEEEMATHSISLPGKFPENSRPWKISMDRGAWQAIVHGVTKS